MRLAVAAGLAVLAAAPGCGGDSEHGPPGGAVAYGIGTGTGPYLATSPNGIGVSTDVLEGGSTRIELRGRRWCENTLAWVGEGRIVVSERLAKRCGDAVLFRVREKKLLRTDRAALPRDAWAVRWSPLGAWVAFRPSRACGRNCTTGGRSIFVARRDGSNRSEIARPPIRWPRDLVFGWSSEEELVVSGRRAGEFVRIDVRTGARRTFTFNPVPRSRVELGRPHWSADRRFVASYVSARRNWIAIATADGKLIRRLPSPYQISMFAWSPTGHRLVWTTSGFPHPHELFVLDEPNGAPRRIHESGPHFDWITWSPDGRWLLLDEHEAGRWRLLAASGEERDRILPRLGGRPLWCCPQGDFSAPALAQS